VTVLLAVLVVVFTSTAQLLLKLGARLPAAWGWINAYVLSGYLLFVPAVIGSYYLMSRIPLMTFTVVMSLNYLAVAIAAHWFLKEAFRRKKMAGTFLIIAGIVVFSWVPG